MNQVCLIGCQDVPQFLEKLVSGFQLSHYYVSHLDKMISIKNKYFGTSLYFTAEFEPSASCDAYIYFGKPERLPVIDDNIELLVILDSTAEVGEYDSDDYCFEYCISEDELAELLGQTAWEKYEKIEEEIVEDVEEEQTEDSFNIKIDALINEIQNKSIQNEVMKIEQYFLEESAFAGRKTIEDEEQDLDAFENAFILMESLQKMLQTASDDDRKMAATAVALMIGNEELE